VIFGEMDGKENKKMDPSTWNTYLLTPWLLNTAHIACVLVS